MRKTLTTLSLALLIAVTPAAGESFLDKALKKVEKGLDALDGKKQPAQKTNQQPATTAPTPATQEQAPAVPVEIKRQSDLQRDNIKGKVKSIVETLVDLKTVTTYTYDEQGNWTKRLTKDKKGAVIATTNRVITYY